jgi:hypothetical protein
LHLIFFGLHAAVLRPAQDFRDIHYPDFILQSFGFRGIFEHRQAVAAEDRQDIRIDVVGFPDSYPRRGLLTLPPDNR